MHSVLNQAPDNMGYQAYTSAAFYEDSKSSVTVDSMERKRKHDVIDPNMLSAKRGLQSDYEYNMAGEYVRAWIDFKQFCKTLDHSSLRDIITIYDCVQWSGKMVY